MTERLYYRDSYLQQFDARIADIAQGGLYVYLDRTAFYPTSGGQPNDTGTLNGIRVLDAIDEDERIAHVLETPLAADGAVRCEVDWPRRFEHMQQHSGQHLLSAVLIELFDAKTVAFHLGTASATIDLAIPELSTRQIAAAERRANEVVVENRPLSVSFEDAATADGLRKPSGREGTLRIVAIERLDRSACGGTHVRATGEIGPILIRKLERVHGNLRMEFLCGFRAIARARADFDALSEIARRFSAQLDETPALVASQASQLDAAAKTGAKALRELAQIRGRELYEATAPNAAGFRCVLEKYAAIDDEVRTKTQSFAAGSKACYLAVAPPAMLLAVSKDAGLHAGSLVKDAVAQAGGRGGGSPQFGQGSVPAANQFEDVLAVLERAIGLRT